jgi:hypothetical protein
MALSAVLLAAPAFADEEEFDYKNYFKGERATRWIIAPGFNGGITKMNNGYDGYDDLGHAGFDVYFNPPRPLYEPPTWRNRLYWRLSADYFPLQVPEGVYGVTEDIYSINNAVGFKFLSFNRREEKQIVPFVAGGFGVYWDRIELDTPASGKVTGMHNYFGVNASAGFFLPSLWNIRLVPEIRWHGMRTTGNYWATHYTFQGSLVLWLAPPRP